MGLILACSTLVTLLCLLQHVGTSSKPYQQINFGNFPLSLKKNAIIIRHQSRRLASWMQEKG